MYGYKTAFYLKIFNINSSLRKNSCSSKCRLDLFRISSSKPTKGPGINAGSLLTSRGRLGYRWWSQRESNPRYRRERPASWPLDDGTLKICMNIEGGSRCQTLFVFYPSVHLFFTFSEPKYQINQPPEKRNHGNEAPHRFLPNGSKIFAHDVDNRQDRQQVKNNADFYPYNYSC